MACMENTCGRCGHHEFSNATWEYCPRCNSNSVSNHFDEDTDYFTERIFGEESSRDSSSASSAIEGSDADEGRGDSAGGWSSSSDSY